MLPKNNADLSGTFWTASKKVVVYTVIHTPLDQFANTAT